MRDSDLAMASDVSKESTNNGAHQQPFRSGNFPVSFIINVPVCTVYLR